jgi:hypothetical protein
MKLFLRLAAALPSIVCAFFIGATSKAAEIQSRLPIVVGRQLGMGGTPGAWPEFLSVCTDKIDNITIAKAIFQALADLSLTIDGDLTASIPPHEQWQTNIAVMPKELTEAHNRSSGEDSILPSGYQFELRYHGEYEIDGRTFVFITRPEVLIGPTPRSAITYSGSYDSRFFHRLLMAKVSDNLGKLSCPSK